MNENENLVPETGAENAEHTAEQSPKTYTEAEGSGHTEWIEKAQ